MICFVLFFLFFSTTFASYATVEAPYAFLRQYNVGDYKASGQNWDLTVSPDGVLYVANNSGLLVFDGNNWHLHELPDHSPVYRVALAHDTVYTQSEKAGGYWIRNPETNALAYHQTGETPAHVTFRDQLKDMPAQLPDEIVKQRLSSFVSVEDMNFIGTLSNGIYVTDRRGDILIHLFTRIGLQDNIVYALYLERASHVIWGALDNGLVRINLYSAYRLLGSKSRVGKLLDALYKDNLIYISTNTNYYQRPLEAGYFFQLADQKKVASYFPHIAGQPVLAVTDVIKDTSKLGSFSKAEHVYPVSETLYWFTYHNEAALFYIDNDVVEFRCRILMSSQFMSMVPKGRQIFPLNDSLHLVSTMQGVLLINSNLLSQNTPENGLPLRFTEMRYRDKEGEHYLSPGVKRISLPYNYQELTVEAGSSVFTGINQISYKLDNVSSGWSDWQQDGKISLLQLPEGEYGLHVRKYTTKGDFPELTLLVKVRAPWYYSTMAILVYAVLLWFIMQAGMRRYSGKLHKKEEEEEKRLRNKMLEEELQNKKNELMVQTSSLMRKNNAINTLLVELDKQKEALGDRYPQKMYNRMKSIIENTYDDKNDWTTFESYFNSAHQNFIQRFSQQYTDITPGDIRMCCLLRMNLSTKEIASLLHVSIRAVELRRYRLRKRIGLENDKNLVEFLLNF